MAEPKIAEAVADYLFRGGTARQADRLLLITEDHSGKAKVSDAQYLGGWSKRAVTDAVRNILKDRESDAARSALAHKVIACVEAQRLADIAHCCDKTITDTVLPALRDLFKEEGIEIGQ